MRNGHRLLRLVLLALSLAPLATSQARMVEAMGSARVVDGAVNMAREQAIQDAMRQAMMQTEAHVDATSLVSTNVLIIESTRVNAAGTVQDVSVLDEWVDKDIMHVRIRAHVPADKQRNPSPAARYRKKVAALQFNVLDRRQIYDLPGIERAMPLELLRRFGNSGQFIPVDGTQYLSDDGQIHGETGTIARIADQLGVQFIVTGVIRDMGVSRSLFAKSRRLEVEVAIFDGLSGAAIARHRFSENVAEAGHFERGVSLFSNAEFMQTSYGRTLDRVLDRQVEMLGDDLAKLPFSARVVQVEGNKVYFNAGVTSRVKPGDVLMTYRLEPQPVYDFNGERFLGYKETPVATLAVHQVQPLFAMGQLEIEKTNLHPGDIIRFGW